jgi:hypothetical protein
MKFLEYDFFITFLFFVSIISKSSFFDSAYLTADSNVSKKSVKFFSGFELPVQQKTLLMNVLLATELERHHFFDLPIPDCIADLAG